MRAVKDWCSWYSSLGHKLPDDIAPMQGGLEMLKEEQLGTVEEAKSRVVVLQCALLICTAVSLAVLLSMIKPILRISASEIVRVADLLSQVRSPP